MTNKTSPATTLRAGTNGSRKKSAVQNGKMPDAIEATIRRRVEEETRRIQSEATAPFECIGNRDGRTAFTALTDQEVREAASSLGDNQLGAYAVSRYIALLEHVGALAFAKDFNAMAFSIVSIREELFAADSDAQMVGLNTMRATIRQSLAESIRTTLANNAEELATELRALDARVREEGQS